MIDETVDRMIEHEDESCVALRYSCSVVSPMEVLHMERIVNLHIEKLPEGVYLASSDDIPGLVAQGRTVTETLEIARDVAKKLLEAQAERGVS